MVGGELLRGLKAVLKEVWSYNMGKLGLLLIVFLVATSIYALIVLPPNFVQLWTYEREYWEDNPTVAPPEWVKLFGVPVAPHRVYVLSEPSEAKCVVGEFKVDNLTIPVIGYVQVYEVKYKLDSPAYPQSVLVRFLDVKPGNITYRGLVIEPMITPYVIVVRPDGLAVRINTLTTYSLGQLHTIRLDDEVVGDFFALRYNLSYTEAQTMAVMLLFGKYLGGKKVEPLQGVYKIFVILVYSAPGVPPEVIKDKVEAGDFGVKKIAIVVKGSAYGLLGTDHVGRDLFLGILYGFPVELLVGVAAAVAYVMIGLIAGVISGYYGGLVDEAIQRTVDIIGNIPLLPILVLVGVIVQEMNMPPWHRLFVIIFFLVVFSWGGLAIIVRSMTLSIKAEPYIEAARAIGASNARIIFRYIIPQILPYAMAVLVFNVPAAILTEAGLSLLGIEHGLPTWGRILADARAYVASGGSYGIWWWILPPGILIGLTSVAFVFLGLTLETIVEPRLRRR